MEGEYGGLIRQTPSVDVGECPQQVVARRSAAVGRRCWPMVSVLHQVVAQRSAAAARRRISNRVRVSPRDRNRLLQLRDLPCRPRADTNQMRYRSNIQSAARDRGARASQFP